MLRRRWERRSHGGSDKLRGGGDGPSLATAAAAENGEEEGDREDSYDDRDRNRYWVQTNVRTCSSERIDRVKTDSVGFVGTSSQLRRGVHQLCRLSSHMSRHLHIPSVTSIRHTRIVLTSTGGTISERLLEDDTIVGTRRVSAGDRAAIALYSIALVALDEG